MIVSHKRTELTSNAILRWADDHKVAWHYGPPRLATRSCRAAPQVTGRVTTGHPPRSIQRSRRLIHPLPRGSRASRLYRNKLANCTPTTEMITEFRSLRPVLGR
jgi:hypothetical protein